MAKSNLTGKTTVPASPSLPIGTIVNYAGDLSVEANRAALINAGWLMCDGTMYSESQYPELFAAIGTAHGGNGNDFHVPRLQDRFIRGATGNVNNTGEVQETATALPKDQPWILQPSGVHTHTMPRLNGFPRLAYNGTNASLANSNSVMTSNEAGEHTHSLNGFDAASVPVNIALYFIIKAREPVTPTGDTPAGAIIAFGGVLSVYPKNWLRCNGDSYPYNDNKELFNTIFSNYGGEGLNRNVPELRGFFLRATNHGRKNNRGTIDPDAATRYALKTGGHFGDSVGSAQSYATIKPVSLVSTYSARHSHTMLNVPETSAEVASALGGAECMLSPGKEVVSSYAGEHTHTVTGGGDAETRPANVSVDFLIAAETLSQSAPPIGTIMSFGGDVTDSDIRNALHDAGWLPCDDSARLKSSYSGLYAVIGDTFGNGPSNLPIDNPSSEYFSLPNLFGLFIRGAGNLIIGTTLLQSQTGAPGTAFQTSEAPKHQHYFPGVPNTSFVSTYFSGPAFFVYSSSNTGSSPDGEHMHAVTGGDKESRPVNVYVDFIIRYK